MSKDLDNRYFITLNKDKIIFSCLNKENKISFTMSHILKNVIRKIYIILDTGDSLSAHLSIKYKLETEKINENKINKLLSYLKNQFNKYSNDQKVIHMTIIKVLIDGKEKDLSLIRETFDNSILEVKFECLKKQTVHSIDKLCSNYQISVEKILLADHLRQSSLNQTENIVFLANKFLNGEDNKEVSWISKKPIKRGFFEKFFNFFN